MSELTDILTSRVDVKEVTPFVMDHVLAATTMTFDRQPPQSSRLEINVAGATISNGSLTITGNTIETVSIPANGDYISTKDFTSVSGMTTSGISDGYIKIKGKLKNVNLYEINDSESILAKLIKPSLKLYRAGWDQTLNLD